MPAKNSKLLYGNRNYIFNKKFYEEQLAEKKKTTLSFTQCKDLIELANKKAAEVVTEENDGFKLPFGLGYIVAGKYLPANDATDWKKTKETYTKEEIKAGKRVAHLNLHTFGYACKIYWFRVGRVANTHFNETLKFQPYKTLSTSVSHAFGSGRRMYSEWSIADFLDQGRLENFYNKKYRKHNQDGNN